MRIGSLFILTLALIPGACQTSEVLESAAPSQDSLNRKPVTVSNLLAKECAVYYAIEDQLEAEGRPANGTIYQGCPGPTSVGADITALRPPPSISDRNAEIFYQKMTARGTPVDVADQVSKSRAFLDWLEAAKAGG